MAESNCLGVTRFPQEMSEWCWAATTQMLLYHHQCEISGEYPEDRCQSYFRQCDIVNRAPFTQDDCCGNTGMKDNNKWIKDNQVMNLLQTLGLPVVDVVDGQPWDHTQKRDFSFIKNQTNQGRQILVALLKLSGGGHMAVVDGYMIDDLGREWVYIADPLEKRARGQILYEDLKTNYGEGDWAYTWLIKSN